MEQAVISKAKVGLFLDALRDEYLVFAPRTIGAGEVVFDRREEGEDPEFDFVNTLLPPKSLFFPVRETLFHIRGLTRPVLTPPPDGEPLAVFGLRSCDATALAFIARFYGQRGFDDKTVTSRVRSALTMTLACHAPGPDCFCVCCEGGPFLASGFDLQFTDLGDRLLVDIGTSKGAAALEKAPACFVGAKAEDREAKQTLAARVDATFQRRSYIAGGMKAVSLGKIPDAVWQAWAEDCQGCGGCCFVCPTCSCFTVADRQQGDDAAERERSWDACLYAGFTREASGHNPRIAGGDRLKRRFFHKMSCQYAELMGRHGCVGCGRCVTVCMGALDISTLLTRIHDECK
jgi:sulfhydrogenase subunit beta (sulfur reductase)